MLKIVIIEREPFPLLGIKTAIEQSPDIEAMGLISICSKPLIFR
ncbi:MAG: hypothetical protein ACYTX0_31865 [Nostoc sp.]